MGGAWQPSRSPDGRFRPDPEAGSGVDPGWPRAPPADTEVDALYVGTDPGELVPYFRTVTRVGGAGAATTWLLTGRTEPWAAFWPGLRHLDLL